MLEKILEGLTENQRNTCIAIASLFGWDIAEETANGLRADAAEAEEEPQETEEE